MKVKLSFGQKTVISSPFKLIIEAKNIFLQNHLIFYFFYKSSSLRYAIWEYVKKWKLCCHLLKSSNIISGIWIRLVTAKILPTFYFCWMRVCGGWVNQSHFRVNRVAQSSFCLVVEFSTEKCPNLVLGEVQGVF